jgi:HipA-like protein
MFSKLRKFFSKGDDEDYSAELPKDAKVTFNLMVDEVTVGVLTSEGGVWSFSYSDDFKNHRQEYTRLVGFPDLDRVYRSDTLWPFFRIRIPGLKQPAVQEIIQEEHIDQENEAELLKRFGRRSISNPYELEPV